MINSETPPLDDVKLWDLPSVEDIQDDDSTQTNAFNRPLNKWKFEAPEQEEDVQPLTAEDIEQIRKAAFEEGVSAGHEQGYEDGHVQGLEAGKIEGLALGKQTGLEQSKAEADEAAKVQLDALQSILEQLQAPLAQVDAEVKNELVLLAISLAKAIIKTEVSQSTESLLQVISESMAVLPIQESTYQIHLQADDLASLQQQFDEQTLQNKRWQLHANNDLARGGCKIVSHSNAVDMSIARRCEQVFDQVLLEQGLVDDPRAS
ncbi:flagellar assembly protein FliH [Glaciecola sp. SC05]|uniref:flagellar assembly protein FliH n=1 Tax=Glaciecola sp. SC05 TaxID=1987355 RepID=UPI0035284CF5